jgi:hypothetical protein
MLRWLLNQHKPEHPMLNKSQKVIFTNHFEIIQVESGKLVLEDAEFDLGRELEGLIDMFSVQCINHNVEAVLDLSGTCLIIFTVH